MQTGKIGRNQPCSCGSGKKFKWCHGSYASPSQAVSWEIDQRFRELAALRAQREKQQGLGRPIIATLLDTKRVVMVGNRMYVSDKWKTFHDFLRDYILDLFSKDWFDTERAKPIGRRHKVMEWLEEWVQSPHHTKVPDTDICIGYMTGAIRAFLNLSYNLYLILHHSENDKIVKRYIDRLKSARVDDFSGALFETYAAAALLKAGFTLEFEDETNGLVSHVEFVATHPKTQKKFSVEVKSREPSLSLFNQGDTSVDNIKRLRIASKLNKALGKHAEHTRVVFIEINVPDIITSEVGWPSSALAQISDCEKADFTRGDKKPPAYVFITNHSFHNNLTKSDTGLQVLATGFLIPDFGPRAHHQSYKAVLEARERHKEMFWLMDSVQTHYEIPSTFDGDIPHFAFQNDKLRSRLQIGRWYLVPIPGGADTPGRLCEAVISEPERKAYGIYELSSGERVVATCPISEVELDAYVRYPGTFFGEIREPPAKCKSIVDWCDFHYKSYKNTSREKLLEWLADAADYERLSQLSQKELAIEYCERLGWYAFNRVSQKKDILTRPLSVDTSAEAEE